MNTKCIVLDFSLLKIHTKVTKLNRSSYNKLVLTNFEWATNPHPHLRLTDFLYDIHIRRMLMLAGSVTSLLESV